VTSARSSVKLSLAATRNIVEQADYYRAKSGESLARRWTSAVRQSVASLRTMPLRGELCRLRHPALDNVRRIEVVGFERFSIFYRVDAAAGPTLILLIVHEARDIQTLLINQL